MLVTKFSAVFKKPFKSTELFTATLNIMSYVLKQTRSGIYLFFENEFSFQDNSAYGTSTTAMRVNDSEIINAEKL